MMSEAPEAGAGMPQSLRMPAKDFTSYQLREARAQAVSLATKNERLVAALGTARERITELGQQLDAVTRPPVTLGLLTGLPGTQGLSDVGSTERAGEDTAREREVAVSLSGRQMLLHVHPGVDDADLRVGRLVAVNDQMLVVAILPEPRTGEAVTLEESLDDARVLVTTGGGGTRILTLSSSLRHVAGTGEGLKPGDTLAADLRADIATALVERTSVEQLVVAEGTGAADRADPRRPRAAFHSPAALPGLRVARAQGAAALRSTGLRQDPHCQGRGHLAGRFRRHLRRERTRGGVPQHQGP